MNIENHREMLKKRTGKWEVDEETYNLFLNDWSTIHSKGFSIGVYRFGNIVLRYFKEEKRFFCEWYNDHEKCIA